MVCSFRGSAARLLCGSVDDLDLDPQLADGEVTADLFGFLTADANQEVGAVHPKAMPVILTHEEELEAWMAAPWTEAVRLQRPLPDGALRIVARGERKDEAT